MSNTQGQSNCASRCWFAAAIFGLLVLVLLILRSDWTVIPALFVSILLAVVAGLVLRALFCRKPETPGRAEPVEAAVPAAKPAPVQASAPAQTDTVEAPAKVTATAPLAGQSELAARKGDWRYEGSAPEVSAATDVSARTGEIEPEVLEGPRGGTADDLKLIGGVGPKLEETLNGLGIYHFDQVANWGGSEIEWVDARLRFKGRIVRDGWVDQAKTLAAGGETEFSARKTKK